MKKALFVGCALFALGLAALAALFGAAIWLGDDDAPPAAWENPATVNVTAPTMLELGAEFCPPCQRMKGELAKLRERCGEKLNLRYHDLELAENRPLAQKYAVESIPVQVFLAPDGRELFRHVGFFPAASVLAKWKELGYAVEKE